MINRAVECALCHTVSTLCSLDQERFRHDDRLMWFSLLHSTVCELYAQGERASPFYALVLWHFETLARNPETSYSDSWAGRFCGNHGWRVLRMRNRKPQQVLAILCYWLSLGFLLFFAQCPTFLLWNPDWLMLWFVLLILRVLLSAFEKKFCGRYKPASSVKLSFLRRVCLVLKCLTTYRQFSLYRFVRNSNKRIEVKGLTIILVKL